MTKSLLGTMAALFLALNTSACSLSPQVSRAELAQVVQREALPFGDQAIPPEVVDRLAAHRVVLVGETHFLQEHRELLAIMLRDLHSRGFRQYLFEWTQAVDWLLDDFVNDGGLEPGWTPPHDIGGVTLTAIRDFNRTLAPEDRIEVHGLDLHLPDYGGTDSWVYILGALAKHFPDPGPLTAFLQGDHGADEVHKAHVEALQGELEVNQPALVALWGESRYSEVVDMVEVELASIEVRALREKNYDRSVRLREDAIKRLVDRRIEDSAHGTLINIGSTHAQKKRLRGTEIEWLGDYLVHKSQAAGGSVIVVDVSAAHIVAVTGSGNPDYDLGASPENELFRVMHEIWPDQIVFLPMDDPLFGNSRVPINFAGEVFINTPKQHYDAFILLPLAHRDFVGD